MIDSFVVSVVGFFGDLDPDPEVIIFVVVPLEIKASLVSLHLTPLSK